MNPHQIVVGKVQSKRPFSFSSFLLKAFVSRVMRRHAILIVKFCRSMYDVQMCRLRLTVGTVVIASRSVGGASPT
jgi:hypothetical protein